MNKRIVFNLLKYVLAFGLLAWVVWKNWAPGDGPGLSYVWQRHVVDGQPIRLGYLLGALVLYASAILLTLARWYVLVRAQDLPFRPIDALRVGLLGFFYSTFLPGSVGGDIVKAAALARQQSLRTVAVATVLMDRLIALWGLIWFVALLGGAFWLGGALDGESGDKAKFIVSSAAGIVAVSAVLWLLMGLLPDHRAERFAGRLTKLPKVGGSAAEFWRAVWMYRCRQKSVAVALLMSWVGFFGFIGCFYCSAYALWDGDETRGIPTVVQHLLFVPIGMVVQAVIPLPGGVGAGEYGFGKLYQWFGCPESNGVLGSLVQRVLSWGLSLAGYLFALWLGSRKLAADAAPEGEVAGAAGVLNGAVGIQARPETSTAS